jgi:hypothetical protein
MGIGLITGRIEPGAPVDENYSVVQELVARFKGVFGSINCQELTGVHLGTKEGQAQFREKNQIQECLNYAEEATRMVLELTGSDEQT